MADQREARGMMRADFDINEDYIEMLDYVNFEPADGT